MSMRKCHLLGILSAIPMLAGVAVVAAQAPPPGGQAPPPGAQPPPAGAVPGMTSPAQSMGLYVFPQKGQTPQAQLQDEGACYGAAKTASGVDPAHLQVATVQAQPATGGAVKGAAGGAAGGAAIGAIAGNAGEGAAIGATVGVLRGARAQRKANAQAQQEAADQTAAAQQQQIGSFKRAMTACLESRNYSVK